jgi:hypothetical protein
MSSINAEIVIKDGKVTYKYTVANMVKETTKELNSFFETLSSSSFFDTGILPLDGSGTLLIRQAMGHTQVAFQHAPGVYRVIWGDHEGSSDATHYDLAMPYRIVIGDFVDNEFYGARHFYSVTPITNENQILYHVNLPNLNCQGYGNGNGVGWICLYHNQPSVSHLSFGKRVSHLIERAGGTEAYNDANMNTTDGPRFYHQEYSKHYSDMSEQERQDNLDELDYLWDPDSWEYKSKNNNYEWTLDPDLWIPVKVKDIDNQDKHCHLDDANFYTFGMAVDGKYRAYYNDPHVPKNYQKFIRDDLNLPHSDDVFTVFKNAFHNAEEHEKSEIKKTYNPLIPETNKLSCSSCNDLIDLDGLNLIQGESVCQPCCEKYYELCASCDTINHYANLSFYKNNFHCSSCLTLHICPHCESVHDDGENIIEKQWCTYCVESSTCSSCSLVKHTNNIHELVTIDPFNDATMNVALCTDCFPSFVNCECGYLRDIESVAQTADGCMNACESCIVFSENGSPNYLKKTTLNT